MGVAVIVELLGIPTAVFGTLYGVLVAKVKKTRAMTQAVCAGTQALLRNELIKAYKEFKQQGYAGVTEKENFENMYAQYHNLGANGVMDAIREEVLDMPTEK